MKILGIFTCFNRKEKSVNAIQSLRKGNPSLQIDFVVADDASTDGTKEALEVLPGVTVLSGDGNSYYTGGMRIAMGYVLEHRKMEYDYVLLCNDDVDFAEGAIAYLLRQSEQYAATHQGEAAIWVGPTSEPTGELSYGGVVKISKFRPKHRIVMAEGADGMAIDMFNANCVLVPKEAFYKIGNMDGAYHHSLGDFDYGLMAGRAGVPRMVSERYVGVCANNPAEGTWRDKTLSRKERFQKKESIKGVPFGEWWHYLCKNYNVLTAIIYSISPYVRILLGI